MGDPVRVFTTRGIYMRRGDVGGQVGPPSHSLAWAPPRPRHPMSWAPGGSPQVPSGLRKLPELLFMAEKISSDSEDIFRVGFLKRKTAENTELALWHLVNRLVPENA